MRDAGRYQTITDMIVSEIRNLKKTIRYLTVENKELRKQIKKLSK